MSEFDGERDEATYYRSFILRLPECEDYKHQVSESLIQVHEIVFVDPRPSRSKYGLSY